MNHDPLWRLLVAVGVSLAFAGLGVYVAVRPDNFVPRSFWKQGEMERTMNRLGTRFVGVIMAAGSLWVVYDLLSSALK